MTVIKCTRCGGHMVQKSRRKLCAVVLLSLAWIPLAFAYPVLKVPGIGVLTVGFYCFMWVTIGKGLWCRNCKRFEQI